MEKYDVIIAGVGFAGLSVASKLNANVLLLDRSEIGSHNISACGTLVETMEKVGCEQSILQKFETATIHGRNWEVDIPLARKFCTFEYERFSKLLDKQNTAQFIRANALGVKDGIILTDKGDFRADIIVDATGWEAALARSVRKDYVDFNMVGAGIETEIEYQDDRLRFFIDSDIVENGAAWLFPAGEKSRFGVGCYYKTNELVDSLTKFVGRYGLNVEEIHGGCFCHCQKDPIVDDLFVVGCAAGQTLPLTVEGIRRCIDFGLLCGSIIQNIMDGGITYRQGIRRYKSIALRNRWKYTLLLRAQCRLYSMPDWQLKFITKILGLKPVAGFSLERYLRI